ncbi:MAG TPA: hypothetical protein VGC90_00790 [Candidatus Limnocylindrales bacterium]
MRTGLTHRSRRRTLAVIVAMAAVVAVGAVPAGAVTQTSPTVRPSAERNTAVVPTYTVLQEVPVADLQANTNGICTLGATAVLKNAAGTFNAVNYLNVAQACGLKVIFSFPDTVDYSTGVVYPSKVAAWVNKVKSHPATWGYLSVKEPAISHVNASEIRSLYSAFKAADPNHPVMALFGDIPHFGASTNPYTAGMANVVMVDWYPVETTNGTNTTYLTGGSTWFPKVKSYVASRTPGVPVWLMVQTHKYLAPSTHKKQRPTWTLLNREVRDGFSYLGAKGIAFHTWRNTNYAMDELRDPQMVSWMKAIVGSIKAGTFK